jgi:hypothetical protein
MERLNEQPTSMIEIGEIKQPGIAIRQLRVISSKTVFENGRIVTKHLVEIPELGRGKAFWI